MTDKKLADAVREAADDYNRALAAASADLTTRHSVLKSAVETATSAGLAVHAGWSWDFAPEFPHEISVSVTRTIEV